MYYIMIEELIPLFSFHNGHKQLFFHYPKTDEVFILRDIAFHNRLTMFGLFKSIYIDDDDLLLQGKKEDILK